MLLTNLEELRLLPGCQDDKIVMVQCDCHFSDRCHNVYNIAYEAYIININKNNGKIKCRPCSLANDKNTETERRCRSCNDILNSDNWNKYEADRGACLCKVCKNKKTRDRFNSSKNDLEKLETIFSQQHRCLECDVFLNKNNWYIDLAIRHRLQCKKCRNKEQLATMQKLKREIIHEYGGVCRCCGTDELIFLNIDHIDENGPGNRKILKEEFGYKLTGNNFYRWLKKQGCPKDNFQVLCFNCNFAKHVLGECPHQKNKIVAT